MPYLAARPCIRISICVLFLAVASIHAATVASRSAVAQRVKDAATRSEGFGGWFAGMVPGLSLTDPITVNASFQDATQIDFGDGTVITVQAGGTAEHTYTSAGIFKPLFTSPKLGTIRLAIKVPFDSTYANLYGFGASIDASNTATFQGVIDQSVEIDPGDGSAVLTFDSGTSNAFPTHTYNGKGTFTATATVQNFGFVDSGTYTFTLGGARTKSPEVSVTEISVTPNPAASGVPVKFSGSITKSNVSGDVTGTLDFGDGSTPFQASGDIAEALKATIDHTYAADGVYEAKLTLSASGASTVASQFVVVGRNTVVNSTNGLISSVSVDAAGVASLRINAAKLVGAASATTEFEDTLGRAAPVDGFIPSRSFSEPGISVAKTIVKNASGVAIGTVRKMIAVSSRATGDSGGPTPPADTEVKFQKVSGKFLFLKATSDQVSFSGTLKLPADFNPEAVGGNKLVVGLGNCCDTIQIDAKGKPIEKSKGTKNTIKKLSVKFPKDAGGLAKIDVTLSFPNMDTEGFDTEGITSQLRADERKLKAAPRFMQVNLVLAGVSYDAYVPLQFKLSSKGDSGVITGRSR